MMMLSLVALTDGNGSPVEMHVALPPSKSEQGASNVTSSLIVYSRVTFHVGGEISSYAAMEKKRR